MEEIVEISVIMSVYNEKETYLRKSIESILKQSFSNFEFIIILDNPIHKKLEDIIISYKLNDNRIVFLKNDFNIGLAASLNRGIKISKGKYIARMDADDISEKRRLHEQLKFMKENNDIDFLFSWVQEIDEFDNKVKDFKPSRYKIQNIKEYFFKEFLLIHPVLFAKRNSYIKNLYDKDFKRSQDFELWLRLIKKYNFDMLEKQLLKYRIPSKNNLDDRINKMKGFVFWQKKALIKNFDFNSLRYYLYFFKIIFYSFVLKLPLFILKLLIKLKDFIKNRIK